MNWPRLAHSAKKKDHGIAKLLVTSVFQNKINFGRFGVIARTFCDRWSLRRRLECKNICYSSLCLNCRPNSPSILCVVNIYVSHEKLPFMYHFHIRPYRSNNKNLSSKLKIKSYTRLLWVMIIKWRTPSILLKYR